MGEIRIKIKFECKKRVRIEFEGISKFLFLSKIGMEMKPFSLYQIAGIHSLRFTSQSPNPTNAFSCYFENLFEFVLVAGPPIRS